MRRALRCALIALLNLLSVGCGAARQDTATRGLTLDTAPSSVSALNAYDKSIVVLIGIDDYASVPKLAGSVRDARAMADALRAERTEIIQVLNGEATKVRLERLLRDDLSARASERDRVIIYFAGHGVTEGQGASARGYLVPVDGDKKRLQETALSMDSLQQWFGAYRSRHVLFIADACYSGLAITTRAAGLAPTVPEYLRKVAASRVRLTLVAGAADEQAVEWRGHGVLTSVLLDGLSGTADVVKDNVITSDEIASFVKPNVARIAAELGHEQHPQLGRVGEGEMLFANPRARPTEAPACPANHRKEEGVCVPATNKVCFGGGVFDRNEGCSRSALVAAANAAARDSEPSSTTVSPSSSAASPPKTYDFSSDNMIQASWVASAYAGVVGEFAVPGASANAPDAEARALALRQSIEKAPAGPSRRDLLFELALLTWDRSHRALEMAQSGCSPASDVETCRSAAVARYVALRRETVSRFEELLSLPDPPAEHVYRYALALLETGNGKAAIAQLKGLRDEKFLGRSEVQHTFGEACFQAQDFRCALTHYEAALLDPELATSRYTTYKKAFCLLNLQQIAEALRLLSEIEALTRGRREDRRFHEDIVNLLARYYPTLGQAPEARSYFAQRAGSRDNLYVVLDTAAGSYLERGDLTGAQTVISGLLKEIESPALRGKHNLTLARIAGMRGNKDLALSHFQAAVDELARVKSGTLALRTQIESDLRDTCQGWAAEARATRMPDTVRAVVSALKLYRQVSPRRPLPVARGSKDWNDAFAVVDES